MKCSTLRIGGHAVIACGPKRIEACVRCRAPASKLCDWKIGNGKTCDATVCDSHATSVGDDKDLCPKHAYAWANHLVNLQGELAL